MIIQSDERLHNCGFFGMVREANRVIAQDKGLVMNKGYILLQAPRPAG